MCIPVISEALWGMGIRPYISGEQGNKSLKWKGTGEQRQFLGTGNIENQDFDFGEQAKMTIFFQGNKGTGTPWDGLISEESLLLRSCATALSAGHFVFDETSHSITKPRK